VGMAGEGGVRGEVVLCEVSEYGFRGGGGWGGDPGDEVRLAGTAGVWGMRA
jgi:hypothetical protein